MIVYSSKLEAVCVTKKSVFSIHIFELGARWVPRMGAGSISTTVARRERKPSASAERFFISHYELELLIIPSPTRHTRRPPATEIACNALSHGARCMDALDQWPGPSSSNLTDGLSQTIRSSYLNLALVIDPSARVDGVGRHLPKVIRN